MNVQVTLTLTLTGPVMDGDDDAKWEALETAVVGKLEAETFHAPHGSYAVVSVDCDDMDSEDLLV